MYEVSTYVVNKMQINSIKHSLLLLTILVQAIPAYQQDKKNVLLIIADDLRPALRSYGDTIAKTPHLDELARRSVVFSTVASQQALCAPSRTSFLTSRRPDTTRIYANKGIFYWRNKGNYTTLPQYFKQSGYVTASIGKVFHSGEVSNDTLDYPYSWTLKPYIPSTLKYSNTKVCPTDDGSLHTNIYCPVDVSKQPEGSLPDIQNTQHALEFLKSFASPRGTTKKPFFLAVGFYKPHIPLRFPREFLKLYPLSSIPLVNNPFLPVDLPSVAYEPWTDLRWRDDIAALNLSFPYGPMPSLYAKKIRQGYYSSVSYIDSLIGNLLHGLEEYRLDKNTVVVFTGDHGWALGEHDEWCKYSNFRVATNVPLFVHVPGLTDKIKPTITATSNALVELVDLMPSLAEICGIKKVDRCPKDSTQVLTCTEGLSFYPILRNPLVTWKKAIFSQYPRPSLKPSMNTCALNQHDVSIMGYSMQTANGYRYTEWVEFNIKGFKANWSKVYSRELYLDQKENENVAGLPEYRSLVSVLSKQLRDGWIGSLPTKH